MTNFGFDRTLKAFSAGESSRPQYEAILDGDAPSTPDQGTIETPEEGHRRYTFIWGSGPSGNQSSLVWFTDSSYPAPTYAGKTMQLLASIPWQPEHDTRLLATAPKRSLV